MNISPRLIKTFQLKRGRSPLVVSIPHGGVVLPKEIESRLNAEGRLKRDTDWRLHELYEFLTGMDVTLIEAVMSRYVIDLNRPPDSEPLYPGANETALCPCRTFDGAAIYRPGAEPDAPEVAHRLDAYWKPYHETLRAELERIKTVHGFAILLDAHSIRNHIPNLFSGTLLDLNIGTYDGQSCSVALSDLVMARLARFPHYPTVLNARFKGGYITRHYGAPEHGVHALQLELSQSCYMSVDPTFEYLPDKAASICTVLTDLIKNMAAFNPGVR